MKHHSRPLRLFQLLNMVSMNQVLGKGLQLWLLASYAQVVIDQVARCAMHEGCQLLRIPQMAFAQRSDHSHQNVLYQFV